jgi:hypothetical protein
VITRRGLRQLLALGFVTPTGSAAEGGFREVVEYIKHFSPLFGTNI